MSRQIIYRTFLLLLVVFVLVETADAQRNRYKRRKLKSKSISNYRGGAVGGKFRPRQVVGFNVNALNYFGDLAPVNRAASTDISFTRPGFGVSYKYHFHPSMSVRAAYNWGRLRGDDSTSDPNEPENQARYWRNLSFRNDIQELTLGLEFYLFAENNSPTYRNPFNVYLFLGAGVFNHSPRGLVPEYDYQTLGPNPGDGAPTLDNAGEWVKLRDLGTEGQLLDGGAGAYSKVEFCVPVSIGATMRLPGNFNAGIEFSYRHTFTDYLDDVSGTYKDYRNFDDPLARIMADRSGEPIAAVSGDRRQVSDLIGNNGGYYTLISLGASEEGTVRGNPDDNDLFFMTQLKLTYILHKGTKRRRRAKFR